MSLLHAAVHVAVHGVIKPLNVQKPCHFGTWPLALHTSHMLLSIFSMEGSKLRLQQNNFSVWLRPMTNKNMQQAADLTNQTSITNKPAIAYYFLQSAVSNLAPF